MATTQFVTPDEQRDMKIIKLEARLTIILEWITGYFGKIPDDLTLKLNAAEVERAEVKLELEPIKDEMSIGLECTVGFSTANFEHLEEDPDPEYQPSLVESNDNPLDTEVSLLTPKPTRLASYNTSTPSLSTNNLEHSDRVKLVDIRSIADASDSEDNEDSTLTSTVLPYSCTLCAASFNSVHELSIHSLIHCEVRMRPMSPVKRKPRIIYRPKKKKKSTRIKKPRDLPCEHCPQKFPTQRSLKRHLKVHHPDKRKRTPRPKRTCDICEKIFIDKTWLDRHMRKQHPETCPDFTCPTCSKSFKTKESLKNHMARVHADPTESFACEICGKTFKLRSYVTDHKKKTHPDPSEASNCDLCGVRLRSRGAMRQHKKTCGTEKTYLCQECGHATKTEGALKSHIQGMHPTEITIHKCPHCPSEFKLRRALREHLDRHFDKRLKPCPYCGVMKDSTNLYNHVNIVHKGRKFQCFYCDGAFSHKAHLKNHYVLKHPELEIPKDSKVIYTKDDVLLNPEDLIPQVTQKSSSTSSRNCQPRSERVSDLFCEPCDAVFVTRDDLELHMIRHEKDPEYKMKRRLPVTRLPAV